MRLHPHARDRFPERGETVRVSDEINIDTAADGTVYGSELLDGPAIARLPRRLAMADVGG